MNNKKIVDKLTGYFSGRKEVTFAYLFGSHAKNDAGKLSDIDVAVHLDDKISENRRFHIRLELIGDVIGILGTDKLDLVVLNDIPFSLSFRVVRDGKMLCCKDELKKIRFEARVMDMYFDQKYYIDRHAELSLERMAKRGIL